MLETLLPMLPMRELRVGLFRLPVPRMSPMESLPGLGAGEFLVRLRHDEVSDLAGDGLARTGISNLAGLAEFDGIVIGLSRGDDVLVFIEPWLLMLPVLALFELFWLRLVGITTNELDNGDGVMFNPDGRFS